MNRNTFARIAVLLLAVVSLALSGCGGDDGVDQSVHDMVTAERDDAAAALASAQAAADLAETEAATALATAQTALTAAQTAQAAAEAARDEARMGEEGAEMRATIAEDAATTAQAAAEEAVRLAQQAAADLLQAQEDLAAAMMMLGTVETERDDAQADLDAAAYAAMAAETRTRAGQLIDELDVIHGGLDANNDDNYVSPGTPGTDPPVPADIPPGTSMNHDDAPNQRDGLGFANTMEGGVVVSTINDEPIEFQEYQVSDSMAATIDGWDSVVLERRNDDDDASQILYAYSDIATAGTITFLEKYQGVLQSGSLTVDSAGLALAASDSFPTRTEGMETFAENGPVFAGTYDGVDGEFQCGDTACVVTPDVGTGALSMPDGQTFTFTPDDTSDTIPHGDGDYLYFGYWLHKPDAAGTAHGFGLVYGGSEMFTLRGDNPTTAAVEAEADFVALIPFLVGEARFTGQAGGKYVTRDLNENAAAIGVFTATAELLASFETSMEAGMVNGVISDFEGGAPADNNWRLTLENASLATIGATAEPGTPDRDANGLSVTQFTGDVTARIGGGSGEGSWVGMFYGNDRADDKPEAIGGAFEVSGPHAAISGAFGAYNQE